MDSFALTDTRTSYSDKIYQTVVWINSVFFKALIYNWLLHSVLKGLVGVLAEMYLQVEVVFPNFHLKLWGDVRFCFLSYPTPLQKIEHIDCFLYTLTLCNHSIVVKPAYTASFPLCIWHIIYL